ncbi:unnamed protein product [Caretta caretta]
METLKWRSDKPKTSLRRQSCDQVNHSEESSGYKGCGRCPGALQVTLRKCVYLVAQKRRGERPEKRAEGQDNNGRRGKIQQERDMKVLGGEERERKEGEHEERPKEQSQGMIISRHLDHAPPITRPWSGGRSRGGANKFSREIDDAVRVLDWTVNLRGGLGPAG